MTSKRRAARAAAAQNSAAPGRPRSRPAAHPWPASSRRRPGPLATPIDNRPQPPPPPVSVRPGKRPRRQPRGKKRDPPNHENGVSLKNLATAGRLAASIQPRKGWSIGRLPSMRAGNRRRSFGWNGLGRCLIAWKGTTFSDFGSRKHARWNRGPKSSELSSPKEHAPFALPADGCSCFAMAHPFGRNSRITSVRSCGSSTRPPE